MFKVIGADGKEYGPVSADQIRSWLLEGRCNATTQAQAEATIGWKTLPQFDEFSSLFPPTPPTPPAIGAGFSSSRPPAAGPAGEWLPARDYHLDIGGCLGEGWNVLTRNFWPSVGITFIATLLMSVPLVNFAAHAGILHYFIKQARGEKAVLEDLFAGFSDRFLHLLAAGLLMAVLGAFACFLLVLPAIYLAVAWQFALPLMLEKRLDFWAGMELSRKMVTKHWFAFFFFVILVAICSSLGSLACFVGVYVTIPWGLASMACAYRQVFESAAGPLPVALGPK